MRISMNGTNAQADIQSGRMNKTMEMDSFSKSINNQIANAQKQLLELSENKDMSMEEKMKRRQEIQQQITDLNNQLRQHQIEQRKEKQEQAAKNAAKKESVKDENKGAGLSQASMTAIISADAAMSQAQVQGSVATRMEGRAGVLEAEIKLDLANGSNVEAKREELAKVQQKAVAVGASQTNTLASVSKDIEEAANVDKTDNKKENVSADGEKKSVDTDVAESVAAEDEVVVPKRAVYSHVDVCL
ncbi:MAG: FlxA-like family protein [Lachnospiraceae bacterium]|nr:FlxA-like family protein [Lachnospiraceae bacterium]